MHALCFYSDLIQDTQDCTFLSFKNQQNFLFGTLRIFERTSCWKFCEQFLTTTYLVRGKIISWRGAICKQNFISWNLAFHFGKNTSIFSEFIGNLYSIDYRQISPKHSSNNDKRNCFGKFWYVKYLSRGAHLRNTLYMSISRQPIRILKKPYTILLIDTLWLRLCCHFACAAASDKP